MPSCPADRNTRLQRVWFRVWAGAVVAGWAALLVNCEIVIPRQGWSEQWGPMVPHESFPGNCGLCHLPERWDALRENFEFDHEAETGYRLVGAHELAACLRCHNDRGPVQAYVSRGCAGCHVDPHQGTLGQDCQRCHDESTWYPGGLIVAHSQTRFPLLGMHASTPCEACHELSPVGEFRGASTVCHVCHRTEAARATNPDHASSGWTNRCERCHTPIGWDEATFPHDSFPLVGGHAGPDCADCHTSGDFNAIPSDCWSCHQDDYEGQSDHVSGNFSHDCSQCHTVYGWDGANVSHDFFPLTAGHSGLDCTQCHTSGEFTSIPSDCFSCHEDDYRRADDHDALGFPRDCTECHGTSSWSGARFDHDFPLRGDHDVTCSECHDGGTTSTFTCLLCHEHSRSRMDDKHSDERDYRYDSAACLDCHPNGRGD